MAVFEKLIFYANMVDCNLNARRREIIRFWESGYFHSLLKWKNKWKWHSFESIDSNEFRTQLTRNMVFKGFIWAGLLWGTICFSGFLSTPAHCRSPTPRFRGLSRHFAWWRNKQWHCHYGTFGWKPCKVLDVIVDPLIYKVINLIGVS